ncbi:hypothetical protein BDF21DRAFT_149609 [Thamnidium elegans]|nr:hypothetical protein BDF21DRAFT_149609 [Thamnidium elegans]
MSPYFFFNEDNISRICFNFRNECLKQELVYKNLLDIKKMAVNHVYLPPLLMSNLNFTMNADLIQRFFFSILGESTINKITTISKRYMSLPIFIDDSSKDVLDKVKALPDAFSMFSMLNTEKIPYLAKRDRNSQTYRSEVGTVFTRKCPC